MQEKILPNGLPVIYSLHVRTEFTQCTSNITTTDYPHIEKKELATATWQYM